MTSDVGADDVAVWGCLNALVLACLAVGVGFLAGPGWGFVFFGVSVYVLAVLKKLSDGEEE